MKGRMRGGGGLPLTKLTPDAVRDIRRRAAEGEISHEIAESYEVHPLTIHYVMIGRTWKHVPDEEPWW